MQKIILLLMTVVLLVAGCAAPSSDNTKLDPTAADYRFVLVRHAEKETGEDPGLTEEGKQRAMRLAQLFSQENVTAIYSTDYKLAMATVIPIASNSKVSVEAYAPRSEEFLPSIFSNFPDGGLFIIAGHSNTIPNLVNQLIGKEQYSQLDEQDYNDLYIVSGSQLGIGSVVQLTY